MPAPSILDIPSDAGDLIVTDGQQQLGSLLLGGGTRFDVQILPIQSAPIRTSDRPRAIDDGSDVGDDWREGVSFVLRIGICTTNDCDDGSTPGQAVDTLGGAIDGIRGLTPFAVRRFQDADVRVRLVRPRRFQWSGSQTEYAFGAMLGGSLELFSPDYRWYSDELHSVNLQAATANGGWTFNWTFNWTFGGSFGGGLADVLNVGNTPSPIVAEVPGPAPPFSIVNVDTGEIVTYDQPVPAGQIVTIDSSTRTVTLDGQDAFVNVSSFPSWPYAIPGTSQFALVAPGYAGTATVRWRDGWNM